MIQLLLYRPFLLSLLLHPVVQDHLSSPAGPAFLVGLEILYIQRMEKVSMSDT